MVETSPLDRRGISGSWANLGSMAGTLLGSGLAALIMTLLAKGTVGDWGWRLTFLLGGVLAVVAWRFARKRPQTPHMDHHESHHQDDSPLAEVLTENRRETVLAVLFASGYGIVFYLPLVYLPTWAAATGVVASDTALQINALGIAATMPLIPLAGWLSDRFWRRRSLLLTAFGAMAVTSLGLFALARLGAGGLLAAQLAFAPLLALPMGAAPAMLVELFPMIDRLTGYSIAYNLGLGIAGGTAPMLSTWLMRASGDPLAPGFYLTAAALLSTAALAAMRDRSREPLR